MAKFIFTMESDDLAEVAAFIDAANGTVPVAEDARPEVEETPAPEKPKATRQRRMAREPEQQAGATSAGETTASTAAATDEATTAGTTTSTASAEKADEEHPMLAVPTLQEIKDKANGIITADPTKGATIVGQLKERFGASAFGAVKVEDYARCMAMLEELSK